MRYASTLSGLIRYFVNKLTLRTYSLTSKHYLLAITARQRLLPVLQFFIEGFLKEQLLAQWAKIYLHSNLIQLVVTMTTSDLIPIK